MKLLMFLFCVSLSVNAREAKVTNLVLEAIQAKLDKQKSARLSPLVSVLEQANVSDQFLEKLLKRNKGLHFLPAKDFGDILIEQNYYFTPSKNLETTAVALHLYKVDIIENEDDFFNDDIYLFYVATDGLIPTGKITNTYKGNDTGDSFLLTESDRVIYPLTSDTYSVPSEHLIVDYSLIESDGDDIEEMKKISKLIVDLAIIAYSIANPEQSTQVVQLRSEVKKLTEVLLERNDDDQHFSDTVIFQKQHIDTLPSVHEFSKTHSGSHWGSDWKYRLNFRLLKI